MPTKKALRIPMGVPIRAYLKKYVLYMHNLQPDQALVINQRGSIPSFLGSLLQGKTNLQYWERSKYDSDQKYFTDILNIEIDTWRSKRGHVVLSLESLKVLDQFLFYHFHDFLLNQIRFQKKLYKVNEVETIQAIMHELDIIDDISFDGLKKTSYRLRKDRKIPVFSCRNSLCA